MFNFKKTTIAHAHILVIDDTQLTLNMIKQILIDSHYRITLLNDALLGFSHAKSLQPDLILLDIMMPAISGFDVCLQLKSDPDTADIPVIFLTASNNPNNVIRGFEVGAVDYLTKPFQTKELQMRVATQLQLTFNYHNLQKTIQERNVLLQILCHDLANPMQAIVSILDIMDEDDDLQQIRNLLLPKAQHGMDLIKLVRQMQSLTENLPLQTVVLKEVLQESLSILDTRFQQKNLSIHIDRDEDCQCKIIAEPISLLNSVFNNILTNAIKFSYRDGLIRIVITEQENKICVNICDQGAGIPADKVAMIFNQQGKNNSSIGTEGETGTGFGMFLVKSFMQAYGGDVSIVDNENKQGTAVKMCFLAG